MKKLIILTFLSIFAFSCTNDDWKGELEDMQTELDEVKEELANQKKLIEALQKNATISGIEQGNGCYTIKFSDGQSITLTNGKTPLINIGENGNWFIDGQDTGKPSKGENGQDGTNGEDGHNGIDGKTPNIEIGKNGNWFIDDQDTGIRAKGIDGENGLNGIDASRLIAIIKNGNFLSFKFSDSTEIKICLNETKLNYFTAKSNLKENDKILLPRTNVYKNTLLVAKIKGNIEKIAIGNGYSDRANFDYRFYAARWIELTKDDVKEYRYFNNGWILTQTKRHGIKLTNNTTVTISVTIKGTKEECLLNLYNDLGDIYECALQVGSGQPFLINNGTTMLEANLAFYPMDINKDIWLIGDSYFSFTSSSRWPYYLVQKGHDNWLSNNRPGLDSQEGCEELENLLTIGQPKTVVWCLGMNGNTKENKVNGKYVINSFQKNYVDKFIKICEDKGINIVLSTIPTVPERQKTGFNEYIKGLGYRYIDFAEAVNSNEFGVWNKGLLSTDKVHPTQSGAVVLASRVLLDYPEITNK